MVRRSEAGSPGEVPQTLRDERLRSPSSSSPSAGAFLRALVHPDRCSPGRLQLSKSTVKRYSNNKKKKDGGRRKKERKNGGGCSRRCFGPAQFSDSKNRAKRSISGRPSIAPRERIWPRKKAHHFFFFFFSGECIASRAALSVCVSVCEPPPRFLSARARQTAATPLPRARSSGALREGRDMVLVWAGCMHSVA